MLASLRLFIAESIMNRIRRARFRYSFNIHIYIHIHYILIIQTSFKSPPNHQIHRIHQISPSNPSIFSIKSIKFLHRIVYSINLSPKPHPCLMAYLYPPYKTHNDFHQEIPSSNSIKNFHQEFPSRTSIKDTSPAIQLTLVFHTVHIQYLKLYPKLTLWSHKITPNSSLPPQRRPYDAEPARRYYNRLLPPRTQPSPHRHNAIRPTPQTGPATRLCYAIDAKTKIQSFAGGSRNAD